MSASLTLLYDAVDDLLPNNPDMASIPQAGSEKWRTHQLAKFSEQRIAELTSINQSLSTLGNCIRALLQTGRTHVPYRDSKLTRLLQDSLGGNTRTGFIVTMSASVLALEETISTLQFADRAKQVAVHAMVNETLDDSSLLRRWVTYSCGEGVTVSYSRLHCLFSWRSCEKEESYT